MSRRFRIVACIPGDPALKERVLRSVGRAGALLASWVSRETAFGGHYVFLACHGGPDLSPHDVIRAIERVPQAAVVSVRSGHGERRRGLSVDS